MPKYMIWSNDQRRWWGPSSFGYTSFIEEAGVYSLEEAQLIVDMATNGGELVYDRINPVTHEEYVGRDEVIVQVYEGSQVGKKEKTKKTNEEINLNFDAFVTKQVDAFCTLIDQISSSVDEYHKSECTIPAPMNSICENIVRQRFVDEFNEQLESKLGRIPDNVIIFG